MPLAEAEGGAEEAPPVDSPRSQSFAGGRGQGGGQLQMLGQEQARGPSVKVSQADRRSVGFKGPGLGSGTDPVVALGEEEVPEAGLGEVLGFLSGGMGKEVSTGTTGGSLGNTSGNSGRDGSNSGGVKRRVLPGADIPVAERMAVGQMCKRLIDHGRLLFLQDQGYKVGIHWLPSSDGSCQVAADPWHPGFTVSVWIPVSNSKPGIAVVLMKLLGRQD